VLFNPQQHVALEQNIKKTPESSTMVQWPWPSTLPKNIVNERGATLIEVCPSPDGNQVVFVTTNTSSILKIHMFNKRRGRLSIHQANGNPGEIETRDSSRHPFFSPDGRLLVLARAEHRTMIFQLLELGQKVLACIVPDHDHQVLLIP